MENGPDSQAPGNENPSLHRQLEQPQRCLLYFMGKLSIQYAVKVASDTSNPARGVIFNLKSKARFEKNPTRIAPLGMCISGDLQCIGFNKQNLLLHRLSAKPPWTFSRLVVNLHMLNCSKHNTSLMQIKAGHS